MPSTQNDDNRPNNQRPLQGRATSEESHTPSGTAAPEPRSATGCPFNATTAAMAQQGERLTTAQGGRLTTADHSLKAGERGPVLLQDHELREKITHFD
ncbi:MAG TPA: catalase HPII, partial [Corynebacterium variabile]|nr:catalase HPII [Corynebacterium variabile]